MPAEGRLWPSVDNNNNDVDDDDDDDGADVCRQVEMLGTEADWRALIQKLEDIKKV